jgi:hypothetical protein
VCASLPRYSPLYHRHRNHPQQTLARSGRLSSSTSLTSARNKLPLKYTVAKQPSSTPPSHSSRFDKGPGIPDSDQAGPVGGSLLLHALQYPPPSPRMSICLTDRIIIVTSCRRTSLVAAKGLWLLVSAINTGPRAREQPANQSDGSLFAILPPSNEAFLPCLNSTSTHARLYRVELRGMKRRAALHGSVPL